ncbi:MAG: Gfo/Idh/MocA family oxidoreductase [Planctomycetota bacterium]|nr:Gfo/Idh/MocA family oxidoreductase [Planctomycetota bacterium]
MAIGNAKVTRRAFLASSAAAAGGLVVVPRHVLGGQGQVPPSETFGSALIGCGGRGPGTHGDLKGKHGLETHCLAACDVHLGRARNFQKRAGASCEVYQDFRRVVERKDIEVVAIGTPPHWHAVISIACMEAGKDVVCEKPATRFVAEGRALADAERRYGRVYQVGTYGRFGMSRNEDNRQMRKLMTSGLLAPCKGRYVHRGGLKVKQWSGRVDVAPREVPRDLDWDLYCGPSPVKPFHPPRHGGTHRWYWDYEGGGLGDMGHHKFDPIAWLFGKDGTAPVKIESHAPPPHPEVSCMWGWVKLTYADGFQIVIESGEWGEPTGLKSLRPTADDLSDADKKKLEALPDPKPCVGFGEAVKTRQKAGGNAEAAHRTACIMHLANIAIRTGRTIHFDPVKEVVVGDDEANRLAHEPMRAPWHL